MQVQLDDPVGAGHFRCPREGFGSEIFDHANQFKIFDAVDRDGDGGNVALGGAELFQGVERQQQALSMEVPQSPRLRALPVPDERLDGAPESLRILGDHPQSFQPMHGGLDCRGALRRAELLSKIFPIVSEVAAGQEGTKRDMDPIVPVGFLGVVQRDGCDAPQFLHPLEASLRFAGGLGLRVQDKMPEVLRLFSGEAHQIAYGLDARGGKVSIALQDLAKEAWVYCELLGEDCKGKRWSIRFFFLEPSGQELPIP